MSIEQRKQKYQSTITTKRVKDHIFTWAKLGVSNSIRCKYPNGFSIEIFYTVCEPEAKKIWEDIK